MRRLFIVSASIAAISLFGSAIAAPPEGKGKGGGGGGEPDPPSEFVPVIAYKVETSKYEDIRLANIEGDQSCLVLRVNKDNAAGRLRGFAYSAKRKRIAYALNDDLYLATWDTDPCKIEVSSTPFVPALPSDTRNDINNIDFSPDGSKLVFPYHTEIKDDTRDLVVVNIDVPNDLPQRIEVGYGVSDPNFSPNFATTNEVFFTALTASYIVVAYNLENGATREIVTGGNLDSSMEVSKPASSGLVRIAVRDNESGLLQQHDAQGNLAEPLFNARDANLAYSCDNSQILYRFSVNWRNVDVYIGSRDGSSPQLWSSEDLRDPEWLCE
ncbi:hypothetical protein OIK40_05940 [Erythrobacter sp. sf7]|uniref:WD40 repeat protein n=1 Tax=Erythrobacter fulvus TaxID=2987523 RepID=A0ABT5JNU0_9SPHN|nr:hypothetical protein [Erythrobacter fulvus]MDC8754184.1 hypothetical protein [Erythrobacter fulvus]